MQPSSVPSHIVDWANEASKKLSSLFSFVSSVPFILIATPNDESFVALDELKCWVEFDFPPAVESIRDGGAGEMVRGGIERIDNPTASSVSSSEPLEEPLNGQK